MSSSFFFVRTPVLGSRRKKLQRFLSNFAVDCMLNLLLPELQELTLRWNKTIRWQMPLIEIDYGHSTAWMWNPKNYRISNHLRDSSESVQTCVVDSSYTDRPRLFTAWASSAVAMRGKNHDGLFFVITSLVHDSSRIKLNNLRTAPVPTSFHFSSPKTSTAASHKPVLFYLIVAARIWRQTLPGRERIAPTDLFCISAWICQRAKAQAFCSCANIISFF